MSFQDWVTLLPQWDTLIFSWLPFTWQNTRDNTFGWHLWDCGGVPYRAQISCSGKSSFKSMHLIFFMCEMGVITLSTTWGVQFCRFVLCINEFWQIAQPKSFRSQRPGFKLLIMAAYSFLSPYCILWDMRFYSKQMRHCLCF